MRGARMVLVVAGTLLLGWLASADATCICKDFDGCSSALQCDGALPGDSCSPPRGATCKVVKGNVQLVQCCCGCSRGTGRVSCLYGQVVPQLAVVAETFCDASAAGTPRGGACACTDAKLRRKAGRLLRGVQGRLVKADTLCGKGKDAAGSVQAAERGLDRLGQAVERLASRNKVTPECRQRVVELLEFLDVRIAAAGQGGDTSVTTTTTTTTSTTLPGGGIVCTPTHSTVVGFPNEYDFRFACTGPDGYLFTSFVIDVSAGYQITNFIAPTSPGPFECSIQMQPNPNRSLSCFGPFTAGVEVDGGRIQTTPAPTGQDFSSSLTVSNGPTFGPFPFTGP